MKGGSLMRHARNVYSQNGEDGVLAEVFRRLGIRQPGTFVEFGTGNGRDLSNSLVLAEAGWSGVWIESNAESAEKARQLAAEFDGRVEMICGTVGLGDTDKLDAMLRSTRVPRTLDFMSIDIDSHDLEVWASIKDYRAKVVLIEINSTVPLGVDQVHGGGKEGASFTSMLRLAYERDYRLACHTGNLVFVEVDYAHRLGLPLEEYLNPNSMFNDMWAQWAAATPK